MKEGTIINNNYQIQKKLGSGAFGDIYLAQNLTNKEMYAVKCEKNNAEFPQLNFEYKLYGYLSQAKQSEGLPKVYHFCTDKENKYLIMQRLGQSLQQKLEKCPNQQMSLKATLMAGVQMLERIHFLHSKGFLHRDLKPDNFLMGADQNQGRVYMIDFGLAKKFLNENNRASGQQAQLGTLLQIHTKALNSLGEMTQKVSGIPTVVGAEMWEQRQIQINYGKENQRDEQCQQIMQGLAQ